MNLTIKKIAEICGTSRGTVDRVVNDRGNVNPALKEKIIAVMEEYSYTPNQSGKALANIRNKYKIGVVINSLGNVFFDEVLEGINDAAENVGHYGIDVIIIENKGYSIAEQLDAIDKLVEKGINALAITPVHCSQVIEKISDLRAKNIPTVLINSDLDGSERMASVASNNRRNGEIAANIANLILPDNGKVLIVAGSLKNLGHVKRVNGFKTTIDSEGKKIEIVGICENDDDDARSYGLVRQYLKEHPEINMIYFCAGGVKGGAEAMIDSGLEVHAITVDENPAVKKYIQEGLFYATITQQPYEQGFIPITMLSEYLAFGKLPEETKIHTKSEIKVKCSKWKEY